MPRPATGRAAAGQGASDYFLVDGNFFYHCAASGPDFTSVHRSVVRNNIMGLYPRHGVSFWQDILARLIIAQLAPRLGTTIVVECKPGATGAIGTEVVAVPLPTATPCSAPRPVRSRSFPI